jgi:hypothetical protein
MLQQKKLATVGWQQPSAGNVKKLFKVSQPHPHAFLKCETIFFVMNGMQQVYFCQNQLALNKPSFNDSGQSYQ